MKLQQLRADDEAVSPVIGVILMVAVTVILAAVIASFVLGMGSSVESTPQASFSFEYDDADDGFGDQDDAVTITHEGGSQIDGSHLTIIVDGIEKDWTGEISAGNSTTISDGGSLNMTSGDSVRIVWSSEGSDQSTTLGSSTVP